MRTRQPYLSRREEWAVFRGTSVRRLYSGLPRNSVVDCHETVDRADTNLNGQKSRNGRSAGVQVGVGREGLPGKKSSHTPGGAMVACLFCRLEIEEISERGLRCRAFSDSQSHTGNYRPSYRRDCRWRRLRNYSHNSSVDRVAPGASPGISGLSQRSLHYEPIFRLLLKVAVKGTH